MKVIRFRRNYGQTAAMYAGFDHAKGVGFLMFTAGFFIELYLTLIKIFKGEDIGGRPLLILGVLLILAGIQLISTGIIAELIVRTYYESRGEKPYIIEEKINTD
ncbi:MAG: hypothetical protein Q9N26_03505 [Aquificota bacterium]|nr:hypothetical protein [Aquificota bacterium]